MLNVNRLIKEYAGTDAPQFIEGHVFKMQLPVPDTREELNEGLNEGLKSVLESIQNNPGIKAKEIAEKLDNRQIKTVDRQIKTLVEKELVERRGSKKTGGYYLKKEAFEKGVTELAQTN